MGTRDTFPIIIGGCYRSGTSLLRRILNAHSRIYCGPEVKFFRDFYGDYLTDPLKHLRYTSSARSILDEDELFDLLGQTFITLHERATMRAGKHRWADKNPENVLYLRQWGRLLGDEWLFVHVARNPLDTLASMIETPFPLTLPRELEARAALFVRFNQAALNFADIHSERYHLILYEKLVNKPANTLRMLMGWLGETFECQQLTFNKAPQQIGLEDPKVSRTSSVRAESVGRWRTMLTEQESELIWRATRATWLAINPSSDLSDP